MSGKKKIPKKKEQLGQLNLSAFEPFPENLLRGVPAAPARSSFMNNLLVGGSGNAGRQDIDLGYRTDDGASIGTSFGTSLGQNNSLYNVRGNVPLTDRLSLSADYSPTTGNMGQEQFGGKLRYMF